MQLFSIGIEDPNIDLYDILKKKIPSQITNKIDVSIEHKVIGDINFCQCKFYLRDESAGNEDDLENNSLNCLVTVIADTIMEEIQIKLIEKIIHDQYFYFGKEEKDKVLFDTLRIMWGNQDGRGEYLALQDWKSRIEKRVAEHLKNHKEIVLDGFIRFRLKDFIREIEDGVDKAVDDLLIEKEYNEFIKLLRYFVEIQEPKIEEVHVLIEPDNHYTLLDSRYRVINNDMLEDLAREISDKNISYDDLLISSLITIAPSKITIHNKDNLGNAELMKTINNVFYGKVTISTDEVRPN